MRSKDLLLVSLALAVSACATIPGDPSRLMSIDHAVTIKSIAPAMKGADTQVYVREVVRADTHPQGGFADRVVLFIHGATVPGEVGFDLPFKDKSWMAYLAKAGYDVFLMNQTGYGRSTRPAAMNDPCNLAKAQQAPLVPSLIAAACAPSHPQPMTTMDSDAQEIGAVVDYLRRIRKVDRVAIIGWSLAVARGGGYAARNPDKVSSVFMFAPAYVRTSLPQAPASLPPVEASMRVESLESFRNFWERDVKCPGQMEPDAVAATWSEIQASDPAAAKWGPGMWRAPIVPNWGFSKEVAATVQTPFAVVAGQHDTIVVPERVRALYDDVGAKQKVYVDLACASHFAQWESNNVLLFKASLEWLSEGKVGGASQGAVRLGY